MNPALAPLIAPGLRLLGETVRSLLDRLIPDPAQRAAAELELRRLEAEGTFEQKAAQALALAQIDTNRTEAGAGAFRGGWRPAVGWVCASALGLQFVVGPLLTWASAVAGAPLPPLPSLDGMLWELLAGLLGLGVLRTAEKVKGAA